MRPATVAAARSPSREGGEAMMLWAEITGGARHAGFLPAGAAHTHRAGARGQEGMSPQGEAGHLQHLRGEVRYVSKVLLLDL